MAEQKLRVDLLLDSDKFASGLKKAEGSLKGFGSKITSIGKSLSTRLTLPIGLAGAAAVKSASNFQKLKTQLNVLTGSVENGAKAFEKLVQFSAQTPFQLDELAKTNNMLIGFGMSADDAFDSLKVLGDIAAVSGGDLGGIALAFGQASAAGRLMSQDINQLINNGVPALKILGEEMGVTSGEVKQLASEGKVSFEILQRAMARATSEGGMFEDGMKKLSTTFAGQFSTLKDNLNIALAEFGNILLPTLTELVAEGTNLLKSLSNLTPEAKKLGVQIAILAGALPILVTAFGGLATAIGFIISPIGLAVAAFAGFLYFFDDIANAFILFKSQVKTYVLNSLIKIEEAVQKYLVEPFKFAISAIEGFFDQGLDFNFSGLYDEMVTQQDEISKKASEEIAKNTTDNLVNAYGQMETGRIQKAINTVMGGLTMGGGRQEESVNAGISTQAGVSQSQIVVPTQAEQITALKGKLSELNTQILFNKVSQEEYNEAMQRSTEVAIGLGESVSGTLQQSIMNLSQGGNFFAPIIESLKKLVVRLLAAATAAAVLNALLPSFGGGAAMKNIGGFKGMFSQLAGIPKFANGGIVSGPTLGLVGEYSGAKSNPEVIAPLNKLQGMIGNKSQNINVGGSFRVQGQDLVLALQKANKERNRML